MVLCALRFLCTPSSLTEASSLVLVFPCVWLQKVLQRRILGPNTWRTLRRRRCELRAVGMTDAFVTFSDIITAAQVCVRRKQSLSRRGRLERMRVALRSQMGGVWRRVRARLEESAILSGVKEPMRSESRLSPSSPRKVLPSLYVGIWKLLLPWICPKGRRAANQR